VPFQPEQAGEFHIDFCVAGGRDWLWPAKFILPILKKLLRRGDEIEPLRAVYTFGKKFLPSPVWGRIALAVESAGFEFS
jgi:hypothetical protein